MLDACRYNVICVYEFCSIANKTVVGNLYLESLNYSKYKIRYNEMAVVVGIIINLISAYISFRLIKSS